MHMPAFILIAASLFMTVAPVSAAETHDHSHDEELERDLGSHVHGEVLLNIVLEADHLDFEMISPAMNITGFEHAPSTEEEQQAIKQAVALLGDTGSLLAVPDAALCEPGPSTIETSLIEEDTESHEETATDHKHHGEHEHDGEHTGHAEFHVSHRMQCENAAAIDSITLLLFSHFPGVEKARVQWIRGQRQGATVLEPDKRLLRFD